MLEESKLQKLFERINGILEREGMAHSVSCTAANVHDIQEAHKLAHADDEFVNGDAGYLGIEKRGEIRESGNGKKNCTRRRRSTLNI